MVILANWQNHVISNTYESKKPFLVIQKAHDANATLYTSQHIASCLHAYIMHHAFAVVLCTSHIHPLHTEDLHIKLMLS